MPLTFQERNDLQNTLDNIKSCEDDQPEIEALPRNNGWEIRSTGVSGTVARLGTLHKHEGWTQALVDQLVRLINEGLPL